MKAGRGADRLAKEGLWKGTSRFRSCLGCPGGDGDELGNRGRE